MSDCFGFSVVQASSNECLTGVQCDGGQPCGMCARRGEGATCEYAAEDGRDWRRKRKVMSRRSLILESH